jgi:hypothetical protein
MGDQSTCTLCHQGEQCKGCHDVALPHDLERFIYTHGEEAVAAGDACLACHDQAGCRDCHGMPMPHPAGYLEGHGEDGLKRGVEVCAGCHAPDGCAACHLRHIHPGVPQAVKDRLSAQPETGGPSPRVTPTTSTAAQGS